VVPVAETKATFVPCTKTEFYLQVQRRYNEESMAADPDTLSAFSMQYVHILSFFDTLHDTASRKRMPNLIRPCMPAHDAITPQIGDPKEALPRFLTTFEHLTACLDLPQPLTCITPNLPYDLACGQTWLF
jgi:hypothetical protein